MDGSLWPPFRAFSPGSACPARDTGQRHEDYSSLSGAWSSGSGPFLRAIALLSHWLEARPINVTVNRLTWVTRLHHGCVSESKTNQQGCVCLPFRHISIPPETGLANRSHLSRTGRVCNDDWESGAAWQPRWLLLMDIYSFFCNCIQRGILLLNCNELGAAAFCSFFPKSRQVHNFWLTCSHCSCQGSGCRAVKFGHNDKNLHIFPPFIPKSKQN